MNKLPSISSLYNSDLDKENQLNVLLNQEPPKEWMQKHPLGGGQYIPVERIEYLMTRIFVNWHIEVLDYKLIANSLTCHVRVHYQDPVSGQMKFTDGVGASPIQTDKGFGAVDFNHMKNDAVMKALPAAKTFAFKDAVEVLGKLFGKDINRKEKIAYDGLLGNFRTVPKLSDLLAKIEKLDKEKQEFYKEMIEEKKRSGEISDHIIQCMFDSI